MDAPYFGDSAGADGAGRGVRPRKYHTGRVVAAVLGCLLVLFLAVGGVTGYLLYKSAMSVKGEVSAIMEEIGTLQDSLKGGDETALTSSVSTITDKAAYVNAEVHTPIWNIAAAIPVIGEDIKSVQMIGEVATDLVNDALIPVTKSLSGMKLSELLQGSTVNIGIIQALSDSLGDAIPVVQSSADAIASLPKAHIPQVQEVLDRVQGPIDQVDGLIGQIKPILDVLPSMLGVDGQRTYLIIAQNNAELRATGGLPGSWGTITVDNGAISMGGDFETILHRAGLRVDITDEERAASGSNMDVDPAQVNTIPDFTRVGELSRDYWAQMGYGNVDGVIAIDPVFLQRLLALTGGLAVPDGDAIDGTNASKVLLSDTYWKYGENAEMQDEYFSSVAALAFENVMNNLGKVDLEALQGIIEQSAQDGRLLGWMANEDEEALMDTLGISGRLDTDPAVPALGVYAYDETISKISWYASIKTQIGEGVKNADGTVTYAVVTTVSNTITPEEALAAPAYVSGSSSRKRSTSDMLNAMLFYAPAGGTISDMTVSEGANGEGDPWVETTLDGLQVLRIHIHAEAQQTVTFTYNVTVSAEATESLALRTTPLAQEALMQPQV